MSRRLDPDVWLPISLGVFAAVAFLLIPIMFGAPGHG